MVSVNMKSGTMNVIFVTISRIEIQIILLLILGILD